MKKKQKRQDLFDKVSNAVFFEEKNDGKSEHDGKMEKGKQTKAFSPHNFHRRVSKRSRYQGFLEDDFEVICKNQEETKVLIQQPYFYIENANLNNTREESKLDYLMLANYNTAQWKEVLEEALKSTPEDTSITSGECIVTRDKKEKGNYLYYIQFESESETLLKNHLLKDRKEPQERTSTDEMEKGIRNGKGLFKDFALEVGMAESAEEWHKASKGKSEEIRRELLVNQIKEIGIELRGEKSIVSKEDLPSVIEDMNQYCAIINKVMDFEGYKASKKFELKKQRKLAEEELEKYEIVLEFEDKVRKVGTKPKMLEKLGDKYEKDVQPFKGIWKAFEEKITSSEGE